MKSRWQLMILCAFLMVAFAAAAWSDNLIKNGGFEVAQPEKPELAADWGQNSLARLSTDQPHSGGKCMGLKPAGQVNQEIAVKAKTLYRLHFWYWVDRPEELRGKVIQGGQAESALRVWIDTGEGVISRQCPFFGYPEKWVEAASYFYAEKDGQTKVSLQAWKVGTYTAVYLDDLSVEESPAEDFQRPNLILDGGFENGGYGFLMGYGAHKNIEAGLVSLEIDPQEFVEGRHSLKIIAREGAGGVGASSNELPMLAGKTYTFSLWLKTDLPERLVQVGFASPIFPHPWCYCYGKKVVGTKWTRYTVTYTVPPKPEGERGAKLVCVLSISFGGTGTVWVDDVKMSLASAEEK